MFDLQHCFSSVKYQELKYKYQGIKPGMFGQGDKLKYKTY